MNAERTGHAAATNPEPAPIATDGPSMHDLVIEDMRARKQFGIEKYGTTLQAHNGRKPLVDAYQEVLDLAVYLRQRIAEDESQLNDQRDGVTERVLRTQNADLSKRLTEAQRALADERVAHIETLRNEAKHIAKKVT